MLKSAASFFDRMMQRYTPDPFVLALLLTFLLFVLGLVFTESSPQDMVTHWGNGFWKLNSFTLQMVMILVTGYTVASTPLVTAILTSIARSLKTPGQAIIATTLLSTLGSWINWGFGLVIGALLCREIIKVLPKANFRLLVASAYSGFLVWHAGLSASIPLLIATPGNFSEHLMGRLVPVNETIFDPFNICAVLALAVTLSAVNWWMGKEKNAEIHPVALDETHSSVHETQLYPAEKIEHSFLLTLLASAFALAYIVFQITHGDFGFDLNSINFIFLFCGFLLHKNAKNFIASIGDASKRVGPILLQFPFYAAIMSMMTDSGLADVISKAFIQISSPDTFALFTFYSAGLVNLFVPSGGGQWAVQSPIIIPAAQSLGTDTVKAAMAIAWGDAWTNMLQPFWALPILAIAGLKLRDIMGYCVVILIASGIVLSLFFYLW
jgi:short-chain fatty acids transporter